MIVSTISYFKGLVRDYNILIKEKKYRACNSYFKRLDSELNRKYIGKNPYRISRAFLQERDAGDIHMYGETPLFTLDTLAIKAGIEKHDCVLDLGSGRGRSLLFFHTFYGCSGLGYEWIPLFCKRANALFTHYDLPLIMKNQSLFADLDHSATIVYLYGCNFSDDLLTSLAKQLVALPHLKKVISISFPISDYAPTSTFGKTQSLPVLFPWGRTRAYIQEVLRDRKSQKATPFLRTDSSISK